VKTFAFCPEEVVISPLKNPVPLADGVQGVAKSPWATECNGAKKWNSTVSPTAAVMVFGEYTKLPLPALTVWTEEEELPVAEGAALGVLLAAGSGLPY